MNSVNKFIEQLRASKSIEKTAWLITEQVLSKHPEDMRKAVMAIAVPHWFDEGVLCYLLDLIPAVLGPLYERLVTLPFVEVHEKNSYRLHELTRKAIVSAPSEAWCIYQGESP